MSFGNWKSYFCHPGSFFSINGESVTRSLASKVNELLINANPVFKVNKDFNRLAYMIYHA